MEFKDIVILRNAMIFWDIDKSPSSETKQFLINLINDKYFNDEVVRIRKKFKFSPAGYDLWKMVKSLKYKNEGPPDGTVMHLPAFSSRTQFIKPMRVMNKMIKDIRKIATHYRLPEMFVFRLFLLISYNAFVSFKSSTEGTPNFIPTKRLILDHIHNSATELGALIIKSKMSKKQLMDFINENWSQIEYSMNKSFPKVPVSGIKSKNIEISEQIYNLNKSGKSVKQILDILEGRNPDDDKITEQWVALNLRRFKNKIKQFPKN